MKNKLLLGVPYKVKKSSYDKLKVGDILVREVDGYFKLDPKFCSLPFFERHNGILEIEFALDWVQEKLMKMKHQPQTMWSRSGRLENLLNQFLDQGKIDNNSI